MKRKSMFIFILTFLGFAGNFSYSQTETTVYVDKYLPVTKGFESWGMALAWESNRYQQLQTKLNDSKKFDPIFNTFMDLFFTKKTFDSSSISLDALGTNAVSFWTRESTGAPTKIQGLGLNKIRYVIGGGQRKINIERTINAAIAKANMARKAAGKPDLDPIKDAIEIKKISGPIEAKWMDGWMKNLGKTNDSSIRDRVNSCDPSLVWDDANWRPDSKPDQMQRFMLKEAIKRIISRGMNPIIEVTAYSPPYWMTISGDTAGAKDSRKSNLKSKNKNCIPAFASYLVRVLKKLEKDINAAASSALASNSGLGFTADDVKINYFSPMNESNNSTWVATSYIKKSDEDTTEPGNQDGFYLPDNEKVELLNAIQSKFSPDYLGYIKLAANEDAAIGPSPDERGNNGYNALATIKSPSFNTLQLPPWQINVHTYSGDSRLALAQVAKAKELPIVISEAGCCSNGEWKMAEKFNYTLTHESFFRLADHLRRDLLFLGAKSWSFWQANWGVAPWGWDKNTREERILLKNQFLLFKIFSEAIPVNSNILRTSDPNTLASVRYENGRIKLNLLSINADYYSIGKFKPANSKSTNYGETATTLHFDLSAFRTLLNVKSYQWKKGNLKGTIGSGDDLVENYAIDGEEKIVSLSANNVLTITMPPESLSLIELEFSSSDISPEYWANSLQIDDSEMTRVGNWQRVTPALESSPLDQNLSKVVFDSFQGGFSESTIQNSSMISTFTGTKILLYGITGLDQGMAKIELSDNQNPSQIIKTAYADLSSYYPVKQLIFDSGRLPQKTYRLKITNLGTEGRFGRGKKVAIDSMIFFQDPRTATFSNANLIVAKKQTSSCILKNGHKCGYQYEYYATGSSGVIDKDCLRPAFVSLALPDFMLKNPSGQKVFTIEDFGPPHKEEVQLRTENTSKSNSIDWAGFYQEHFLLNLDQAFDYQGELMPNGKRQWPQPSPWFKMNYICRP